MIPLRIAGADVMMTAPDDQPDVRPLWIRVIEGYSVSRWEPTPDELATLNAGGSVELWVMGRMSPVALMVAEAEQHQGDQ